LRWDKPFRASSLENGRNLVSRVINSLQNGRSRLYDGAHEIDNSEQLYGWGGLNRQAAVRLPATKEGGAYGMISTSRNQHRAGARIAPIGRPAGGVPPETAGASSATTLDRLRRRNRGSEPLAIADALAQERRRIAADIHDLIMQDLAFALASARALADDAPATAPLAASAVAAGERSLAGARALVAELIARDRKTVLSAVEEGAREAARHVLLRFDADDLPAGVQPDQPTLDALVHITREAVTNAVKHADPGAIEVVFAYTDEWRLQVRDDGRGFDAVSAQEGFGLESMKLRVHALCGSLRVTSAIGSGTAVEVTLP
jgi:signal transduction histidine kinase